MTATHVAKKCRSPLFGLAMIRQEADPPGPWQSGLFEVYAVRWQNARTGKAGWLPAVRGGWRKGTPHAERDYLPLTPEVLTAHLSGQTHIGLYPLLDGDKCWWLAADFDGPAAMLDALAYL